MRRWHGLIAAASLLAGDLADGSVIQVGAGDEGLEIGRATVN